MDPGRECGFRAGHPSGCHARPESIQAFHRACEPIHKQAPRTCRDRESETVTSDTRVAALSDDPGVIAALSDLLVEVVANGGSIGFMHPVPRDVAMAFWRDSLSRAASGGRVVLGAWEGDELVGTVTLDLATPTNQPHRADIAKMMTRVDRRGRGVATGLIKEAERSRREARPDASCARHRGRRGRGGLL